MHEYELMDRDGVLQCMKKGSALATEMGLSGATGKAIGAVAQAGVHSIAELMHDFSCFGQAPLNVGTMQASLALEASGALSVATAIEGVGEALAKGGDVAGKVGQLGVLFSEVVSDKPKPSSGDSGVSGGTRWIDTVGIKAEMLKPEETLEVQKLFKVEIPGVKKKLHKNIVNINDIKLKHICVEKHNLHKLLHDPNNYEGVIRLFNTVLCDGTLQFNSEKTYIKYLTISGEKVVVRGTLDGGGEIYFGTGWIE